MLRFLILFFLVSYTGLVAGNSLGDKEQSYIVTVTKNSTQKDLAKEFGSLKIKEIKNLGNEMFHVVFKKESDPGLGDLKKRFNKSKKIKAIELNQKYSTH